MPWYDMIWNESHAGMLTTLRSTASLPKTWSSDLEPLEQQDEPHDGAIQLIGLPRPDLPRRSWWSRGDGRVPVDPVTASKQPMLTIHA